MATNRTVLMLHGYSQNANLFSMRLDALKREASDVELVFLDAPLILQPGDLIGSQANDPAPNPEAQSNEKQERDPTLTPRAWLKWDSERKEYPGVAESIAVIRDVLKERRFDGVFGFSQGAAFAAIISALLEKPYSYPPFLVDGKPPHPPFKFCIAVSGFQLPNHICDSIFASSFSTPTLHIFGKKDMVILEKSSRKLTKVSSNKQIVEHEGGHIVPLDKDWLKLLVGFMRNPFGEIVLPGPLSVLVPPPSGTATVPISRPGPSVLLMKL